MKQQESADTSIGELARRNIAPGPVSNVFVRDARSKRHHRHHHNHHHHQRHHDQKKSKRVTYLVNEMISDRDLKLEHAHFRIMTKGRHLELVAYVSPLQENLYV